MTNLGALDLDAMDYDPEEDDTEPSPHGRFLRGAARPGSASVRAWHGVIPAQHLTPLKADAMLLKEKAPGETFWIDAESTPRCSLEQLALAVLRFHAGSEVSADSPPVRGAEFWIQVRGSDGSPTIALHWDSDELHKRASGEHLPPWLATVTYLGSSGAPTVVLPAVADAHGRAVRAGACCAHLSHPVPGKHLAFDGRLLHGALHDMQAPSAAPYVRISLLVNVWLGHRPAEAATLPPQLAASLSNAAVAHFGQAVQAVPVAPEASAEPDAAGWRSLKVGFVPRRSLCDATPGWRTLGLGFPFFHPPLRVRGLPPPPTRPARADPSDAPHVPSLLIVRTLGLELPFGDAPAQPPQQQPPPHPPPASPPPPAPAAVSFIEAAAELRSANDWIATRALRALLPRLGTHLRDGDGGSGAGKTLSGQEEAEAEEGRDEGASGDHRWIGGEPTLLYLAREGLEACALAALAALAPPRASHPGGATPTGGATASDAAVSTDNLQGSATSPPSDQCLSGHQPAAWHDPCAAGIDAEDADGFTALHFAANMGLRRLSAALLACGAAVDRSALDVSSLHEPGGRTPLHLAAASGQSAIVSLLLAADAPHSAEDWQGATPFQMACRRGHHAVAAQISSWATRCGGGASEVPTEQELRGFELVEGMAVRERARRRRCIDGRPLLQTPFTLDGLLSDDGCRSLIAAAEGVAARRGWLSSRHRYHSTVDMPLHVVPRAQYAALRSLLDGTVLPTMRRRYATAPLRIREAFVVKYEAAAAPPPADGAPADTQGTHATAAAAPRQAGIRNRTSPPPLCLSASV